mmetsp:Transcript_41292/g.99472  ORF Transcript_41292/g.99472 Transcript_41292/m.99472 type:complete len:279 (+) Transcript_41292:1836-2672(+)
MIDDITITSPAQFKEVINQKRRDSRHQADSITIQFAKPRWAHMNGEGIPTMAFDQLNVVAHHLSTLRSPEPSWMDSYWPDLRDQDLDSIIRKGIAVPKMTHRKLKAAGDPEEWIKFKQSECLQLDKYNNQGMFGESTRKPLNKDTVILPWVWKDPITLQEVAKSRGTCNGGTRFGKIVTLAETYAACVEQHATHIACSGQLLPTKTTFAVELMLAMHLQKLMDQRKHSTCRWTTNSKNGGPNISRNHPYHGTTSFQFARTSKDTQRDHDCGTNTLTVL